MKNLKRYFYFSKWVVLLAVLFIIISLVYLICFDAFGSPISYLLYLLMSYSLTIVVVNVVSYVKGKIDKLIDSNKYLKMYKDDYKLRYKLSLCLSTLLNVIYALFKFISGVYFKSIWFITFSLYYCLLIILRVNILKEEFKKNGIYNEYEVYKKTGVFLLVTNVILSMIILVIVNEKIMNIYPVYIAITAAVYTFYLVISSIINLIKYRKFNNPLVISSKVINVITSLVGIISLEIILIPTFDGDLMFFEVMVMCTGLGVAIIISIISLYMIIKGTEYLNRKNIVE